MQFVSLVRQEYWVINRTVNLPPKLRHKLQEREAEFVFAVVKGKEAKELINRGESTS